MRLLKLTTVLCWTVIGFQLSTVAAVSKRKLMGNSAVKYSRKMGNDSQNKAIGVVQLTDMFQFWGRLACNCDQDNR